MCDKSYHDFIKMSILIEQIENESLVKDVYLSGLESFPLGVQNFNSVLIS